MTGITQLEWDVSVDLRFGQPDLRLLPAPLVARHIDAALAAYGPAALAYGANAGPLPARAALASWSRMIEGGSWGPEDVFVTAGASHALTLFCRELGCDGDCVLVQRTSYNLALDLFRYHGLQPCPVGIDPCVPTVEELAEAADAVRRAGRRIAFAYFVPTFHNPTGRSWTPVERADILRACEQLGITIVEDDPYRELFFTARPPPSLAAMSGQSGVIGVRTLSKVLAPGMRVGWVLADRSLIVRLERTPLFASGGGITHIAALAAASLIPSPEFAAHLEDLRRQYRNRRDALLRGLASAREDGADWRVPEGGFFLWLRFPDGVSASDVEGLAAQRGVPILNGQRCRANPAPDRDQCVRVSFSMHSPAVIATAGEELSVAIAEAARRGGR
jgi:2-aminoadipate transaminase